MTNAGALKAGRVYRERLRAAGLSALVDAAPVRDHVNKLIELGLTGNSIAQHAGLPHQTVRLIISGETRRVRHVTAIRILQVTHRPHEAQAWAPALGAVRRIRALHAYGWTTVDLGDRLGMNQTHVTAMQHREWITRERWQQVADLYDQLSTTPGPSSITRQRAAAKGWLNPFEWEGYDIDDPRVTPPRSARRAS